MASMLWLAMSRLSIWLKVRTRDSLPCMRFVDGGFAWASGIAHQAYSEARYVQRLRVTNSTDSPLADQLAATKA